MIWRQWLSPVIPFPGENPSAHSTRSFPVENQATAHETHSVGHSQRLTLSSLRALQRLLDPAERLGVQGLGRGDNDLEFASVSSDERVEIGEDLLGRGESAVLGEDGEEVEEDGGGGGWDKAGKSLDSVGGGEGGVF